MEDIILKLLNEGYSLEKIALELEKIFGEKYSRYKVRAKIKEYDVKHKNYNELFKYKDEIQELLKTKSNREIRDIINNKYNLNFSSNIYFNFIKSENLKTRKQITLEFIEANKEELIKLRKKNFYSINRILNIIKSKENNNIHITRGILENFYKEENIIVNEEDIKKTIKSKTKDTLLKVYGVDNPMKNRKIKEKAKQKVLSDIGVDSYSKINISKETLFILKNKNNFQLYCFNRMLDNKGKGLNRQEEANKLNISLTTICRYINKYEAQAYFINQRSYLEQQIIDILNKNSIKLDLNIKSIITPYEIDIYLPELKIGIEINPTYTHNSTSTNHWGNKPKDKYYHQNKYLKAKEAGIQLIQLYDWDFKNSKQLENYLLRQINNVEITNNKIYKEVNKKEAEYFINKNSLNLKFEETNFCFGTYFNEELRQLIIIKELNNKQAEGFYISNYKKELNVELIELIIKKLKLDKFILNIDINKYYIEVDNNNYFSKINLLKPNCHIEFCKNKKVEVYDAGVLQYIWEENKYE